MGEVRVKVTLSNASDEALVRRGALPPDQVRRWEAEALVDAGAVGSVAPVFIVQQLGLFPTTGASSNSPTAVRSLSR